MYKIKIEPRALRVLTIPGRLSSDLQSIVIPVFPFCSAILRRHSPLHPVHPRSPFVPFFLNPRRFRPCRVEFESTSQNRGVTRVSYVSLRHAAVERVRALSQPRNESRPAQERATRADERFFRPTSRCKMLPSSSTTHTTSPTEETDNRIISGL